MNLSRFAPSGSSGSGTSEGSHNQDNASGKSETIYSKNSMQSGSDGEYSCGDQGSQRHANIGRDSDSRSIFGDTFEGSTHSGETGMSGDPRTTDDESVDFGDAFWNRFELPPKEFEEKFLPSGLFGAGWNRRVKEGAQAKGEPLKAPNGESAAVKLGNILPWQKKPEVTEQEVRKTRHPLEGGDSDGFGDETYYGGRYGGRGEAWRASWDL
jgi:hypothetical protein